MADVPRVDVPRVDVRRRAFGGAVLCVLATMGWPVAPGARAEFGRSITYVGVIRDQVDFEALGIGAAGYWFPQFDAPDPVADRPTGERARDALPPWVAAFNHWSGVLDPGCDAPALQRGCIPTFFFRSFSQDGPARSTGGRTSWNTFTLPSGEVGRSGAIVDPHTRGNSNNTINRVQLRGEVPPTFYVHIVTDNTSLEHDPTGRIQARGNVGPLDGDLQVEADRYPQTSDLTFNAIADVYSFRFDGFVAGDYVKLRLQGDPAPAEGASFGGLLFD